MIACGNDGDYLSIVKMFLTHSKIDVNQQNKVILMECYLNPPLCVLLIF
jgi:hypothetical protein